MPDLMQPILIIAPEGRAEETVKRLARIGCDNSIGYLKGGFESWKNDGREIDTIDTIGVKKLEEVYNSNNDIHILDVRKPDEWKGEHIADSQNFPLDFINRHMSEVSTDKSYYMHCRSGYRSTVAASILKSRGFEKLVNIHGTFDNIGASSIPTTDYVCPSTLK